VRGDRDLGGNNGEKNINILLPIEAGSEYQSVEHVWPQVCIALVQTQSSSLVSLNQVGEIYVFMYLCTAETSWLDRRKVLNEKIYALHSKKHGGSRDVKF